MEFMISLSDVEKARSIAERYKVLIREQFFLPATGTYVVSG